MEVILLLLLAVPFLKWKKKSPLTILLKIVCYCFEWVMARHAWLCPARYRVAPRRVMTHLNNVAFNLLNVLPFSL